MSSIPDVVWLELAPDSICEIISSYTAAKDRVLKLPIYRSVGVECLWLVDPEHKTLEACQAAGSHWVLLDSWADDETIRVSPLDAVELALGTLWID